MVKAERCRGSSTQVSDARDLVRALLLGLLVDRRPYGAASDGEGDRQDARLIHVVKVSKVAKGGLLDQGARPRRQVVET